MSQKIVLTGGCFDILHIGRIKFLKKLEENRKLERTQKRLQGKDSRKIKN